MQTVNTSSHKSNRKPILGCIADDVTGATDLAINLVQGGMRVVQILGEPCGDLLSHVDDVDAVVVALKSRSIPKADAIHKSLASLKALQQLGISRFYFKYCSTFDSTQRGNIGPVAEALMDAVGVSQTVFCPAFPRAGRTVYRGHLFVGDKLLNESGMENHPLNPMTDANLVRFLSKQVTRKVGLLAHNTIDRGAAEISAALATLASQGVAHVIADTCDDRQLDSLAEIAAAMPLVTGGSGLARYLPPAYRAVGLLRSDRFVPRITESLGRSAIIAGSCSIATNEQVQWMKSKCPTWMVDVAAVMADAASELEKLKAWAAATETTDPLLIASTALPGQVSQLQNRFDAATLATAIEHFLGSAAQLLTDEFGVRRLVLAGGETSGAITKRLDVKTLQIGPEICAGVPWTETIGRKPQLSLALKSGNFGAEDFFATALEMLA